jgi:beta-galactosidase/beta-glucuronidase
MLLFLCLMLIAGMVMAQVAAATWHAAKAPLMTRWAKAVSPRNALPEYPRPQMVRKDWLNLNGLWELSILADERGTVASNHQILVPYPVESALSGVMERAERLRYHRTFEIPQAWAGQRVILHFGAVDWQAKVSINGAMVMEHEGGYDGFSVDITDHLTASKQDLVVEVFDPSDGGNQPRGKQVNKPGGIFYTPCTGIWQTVWLEPVPQSSIRQLIITPDVENSCLRLRVRVDGSEGVVVRAVARDGNRNVGAAEGAPGEEMKVPVPNAKLWSPSSPFLYGLNVSTRRNGKPADSVRSYFGMRSIDIRKVNGIPRMMLNGKPVFQVGPLDQGFWPDGIYTAPTDAALKYDIAIAKKLGFNMIRKHVKVEPERWYYWCDKMGMLVWQDMPSGDNKSEESRRQFERELQRMVRGRHNNPCIIMWVPFNEGWGQYDTERIAPWVKSLDPSRLVNNASGWTDAGVGDTFDTHSYPAPKSPAPVWPRVAVVGEFGGLGLPVRNHTWTKKAWGYQTLKDRNALTAEYVDLFRQVWALKDDPGICAVVYTQTTDVETECNGILTYDRAIIKMDSAAVRAANTGQIPPPQVKNEAAP